MIYLIPIFIIGLLIELILHPRFGYTHDGWILLWYGSWNSRDYIALFRIKK